MGGWREEGRSEERLDESEHHDYVQDRSEASSREIYEWVKRKGGDGDHEEDKCITNVTKSTCTLTPHGASDGCVDWKKE